MWNLYSVAAKDKNVLACFWTKERTWLERMFSMFDRIIDRNWLEVGVASSHFIFSRTIISMDCSSVEISQSYANTTT